MVAESFYLTQALYDEIVAHTRAGKPQEVCGILRGRAARAFEAVRGRNVASDPIHDYEVDPQTLLRQSDFEEAGDELVAIYHSHPASPAYPSASDAWNALYPDCAYLICSLQNDDAPVMRAFRLIELGFPLDVDSLCTELEFDETRPGRFGYFQSVGTPIPVALRPLTTHVPFYIVFESSAREGKNPPPRVVSVLEIQIKIVPN